MKTQRSWKSLRHSPWIWASALSLIGSLSLSAPAEAQAKRVTASTLNVRTGPSTRNSIVGRCYNGQVYAQVSSSSGWVKINYGSRQAWVYGRYTANSSASVRRVTASSLNVRSGPSTRYRSLGRLGRNAPVAVVRSSGSWRQIYFNGSTAWVHGAYLSGSSSTPSEPQPQPTPPSNNRPTSSAGFIQLASSGTGFYAYGTSSKRWGRPEVVYGIERVGRRVNSNLRLRMGVGNISLQNGGRMPPHSSHRRGVDVDVRPMRSDGRQAAVTIHQSAYSRSRTRSVISYFKSEIRTRIVLFNDSGISGVRYWAGHANHFHFSANY